MPLVRYLLAKMLEQQPGVHLVGEAANIAEATALVAVERPDVVFLDISMPPESGFDLLPHLPPATRVVFVTAHDEHAVRAFEAKALDYLLKPVQPARLAQTIERLRETVLSQGRSGSVVLGDRRTWDHVPVLEIAAVLGEGNYSRAYTLDGEVFLVRRPMQEWRELPGAAGFVELGRSQLVNPAAVTGLEMISRDESLLHLAGFSEPIKLGRAAGLRARRQLAPRDA